MTARTAVLATLALTALTVAPAAAQNRNNSSLPDLWKRDTQFQEIWWSEARPANVEECLEAGANPDARIALGTTPLHIAIDRCRQILVRALPRYVADPNATRALDQTPLEIAESCSNASERDNIVRMLWEAGATGR